MKAPKNLGELQLAILRVLWDRGEAAVADVHAALADRGLALTTIATMLRKMEDKRLVKHRENGRQFLYRAVAAPELVHKHMVGDLVERLFDGDPLALVSHLLAEGDVDLEELEALRQRVRAAQAARKEGPR
ncbi:MAG: BlaI/MecI/CopY family transcriptional regulator [Planctomycetes bacterium]|nr:BlaI/MecI/CopY family transcriptional regulator [Planctomycetota bacterium]